MRVGFIVPRSGTGRRARAPSHRRRRAERRHSSTTYRRPWRAPSRGGDSAANLQPLRSRLPWPMRSTLQPRSDCVRYRSFRPWARREAACGLALDDDATTVAAPSTESTHGRYDAAALRLKKRASSRLIWSFCPRAHGEADGTRLAPLIRMRPIYRTHTTRGLGSPDTANDSRHASGVLGLTCRPPAAAATSDSNTRYSVVTPRRKTLAMPLPANNEPEARRRKTVLMPFSVDELDDAADAFMAT